MPASSAQRGQATVELVALLPLLALVGLLLWQVAVIGQAIWLAGSAARAAARAEAIGADPLAAARRTLPSRLEEDLRVRPRERGGVTVTLRIPAIVAGGTLASTTAGARFVAQRP
jgi:hypothetical protein